MGPQPRPDRRAGHLSDRFGPAGRPAREIGPGISDYGSSSFVYVIFDDDTDLYWARSRTPRGASSLRPRLPEDATTCSGRTRALWAGFSSTRSWILPARTTCRSLRSYRDWTLKLYLRSVPGSPRLAYGRRIRQTVPGERRSQPAPRLRPFHPARRGGAEGAATATSAGASSNPRRTELIVRLGTPTDGRFENVLVATGGRRDSRPHRRCRPRDGRLRVSQGRHRSRRDGARRSPES